MGSTIDVPESPERMAMVLSIWKFVKDPGQLPPLSQVGTEWICSMRKGLAALIGKIGVDCNLNLGRHIKKTGLTDDQMALPLFKPVNRFPTVRQDTIHQVKGESIDAVLVIGSSKFWNSVVGAMENGENSEDRRLAYVAMTRARHLLVLGLPKGHFDKHSKTWMNWGFKLADEASGLPPGALKDEEPSPPHGKVDDGEGTS